MGDGLGILARLAAETHIHHAEADADLDRYLFNPTTTRDDYRAYLSRVYGFVMPLEAALATVPGLSEIIDVNERVKAPALLHDLVNLGATLGELDDLPQCLAIPVHRGPASALGWMYVVERPMLASAVVRRHLATRLPQEMAFASAYLQLYSGTLGTRWRALGIALERVAQTKAIADRIIAAANEAFRTLSRWRKTGAETAKLAC